jgi:hypothetical protein
VNWLDKRQDIPLRIAEAVLKLLETLYRALAAISVVCQLSPFPPPQASLELDRSTLVLHHDQQIRQLLISTGSERAASPTHASRRREVSKHARERAVGERVLTHANLASFGWIARLRRVV